MEFESLLTHLPDARWLVVSPGRVNLLGEHVDYNQGMVLPAAIERCVMVAAKPRADRQVMLKALDMKAEICFSLDHLVERIDLEGKPLPGWALYPAGVAWALRNSGFDPQGVEAMYASDLPIGAGLSSSAAVEVAYAVLWQTIGGWNLSRMRLAQICQMAENRYVGVNCGLMDQFTCAHGVARHALFLMSALWNGSHCLFPQIPRLLLPIQVFAGSWLIPPIIGFARIVRKPSGCCKYSCR